MVTETTNEEKIDYKFITIVISVGLLLGLIMIFTVTRYAWVQMSKATVESSASKKVLEDTELRLNNLTKLSEKEEELKKKNETVLAALPNDKDISALFVQLEKAGEANMVEVTNVTESPTTAAASPSQIVTTAQYSLSAKANSYESLKGALTTFESTLRILSIPVLEINGTSEKGLDISADITTYLRGQK